MQGVFSQAILQSLFQATRSNHGVRLLFLAALRRPRCRWRRCGTTVGGAWLLGGLLLLSSGSQAATADDYLQQIETQARQRAAMPITTKAAATTNLEDTERLLPGLQQEIFEKTLREQFIGTYVFYQRLDAQDRTRIFEVYKQDNRVGAIREHTLKLLSGGAP